MSSTNPGDLILDPFFGTGTTGAVAKALGRDWLGIEREEAYVKVATDRIERVQPISKQDGVLTTPTKRGEPRVPFGSLVEHGLLRAGDRLFDIRKRVEARVNADGSIAANNLRGSIHKVGAQVQKTPACNGWTYWHFDSDGESRPIDELRERIRTSMADTLSKAKSIQPTSH